MDSFRKLAGLVPLLLAIVVIVVSQQFGAVTLSFSNVTTSVVTQLFGVLFTVALLLERSLEVFVNVWREPDATQLELKCQEAQLQVTATKALDQANANNVTRLNDANDVLSKANS